MVDVHEPLASIIIRTNNEEKWIGRCIEKIKEQSYRSYEIIVVDTGSTDNTIDVVEKIIDRNNIVAYQGRYLPGKALNVGCRRAGGEYLVFLSAHCLPVNENWLEQLLAGLFDPHVAGVYGKQEPMEDSNPLDKRDLIITFGDDRRVQWRDPFFHNANSAIRKELWEKLQFDENASNIEDRIWAASMQNMGYCVVYEPKARVYHQHGIHQSGCETRARGVVGVIDNISKYVRQWNVESDGNQKGNIFGVVPFSRQISRDLSIENVFFLYDRLISDIENVTDIAGTYLLTDCAELVEHSSAKHPAVEVPYLRKGDESLTLLSVLQEFVKAQHIDTNDALFVAELIYAATGRVERFQKMCTSFQMSTENSVHWVANKKYSSFYKKIDGALYRLDDDIAAYRGQRTPFYETEIGLGMIVDVGELKRGRFISPNALLLEIEGVNITLRVEDDATADLAGRILQ